MVLGLLSGGVCTPCPPGYYGTLDNPLGVRTFVIFILSITKLARDKNIPMIVIGFDR
jgi:hypothetical protein